MSNTQLKFEQMYIEKAEWICLMKRRESSFTVQLAKRFWAPFPLKPFAVRTPGWSPAKLASPADRAGSSAALENRRVEQHDMQRAYDDTGGTDRP